GREPTTPKRDVKGLRTILLVAAVQTAFNSLQRRNTRFPANCITDRAAEDDGGEAFQHSSEGPLQPPLLSAHARRRRIEKRPNIAKTIPGRHATLRSTGRGSRVAGAKSGNINSATSSPATVRRTGEARYPKSPCPHRCGREPDLSNYPQDRVCGSEGRGSERHRRLLGDADPRHFRRHHLSHCRPVSGPHDIRLRLDAAPLPARGGLRPDRPL